jgi:caa(3)-type oxidase subunit IV
VADTHDSDAHHGPNFRIYLLIFGALSVFTVLSFVVNWAEHQFGFSAQTGASIIMVIAVCKAVLVGLVFMHLKWDWSKLYFMIIPAFILGTMMMIVLLPDIVIAWHQ